MSAGLSIYLGYFLLWLFVMLAGFTQVSDNKKIFRLMIILGGPIVWGIYFQVWILWKSITLIEKGFEILDAKWK